MTLSSSPRVRTFGSFVAAVSVAATLTGCDPAFKIKGAVGRADGAQLKLSARAVDSGGKVTLDISGSTLQDTEGACATVAHFFLDDMPGADVELTTLKTVKQGDTCTVVDQRIEAPLTAPAGTAPGTTVDQDVSVAIAGQVSDEKGFYESVAEDVVKVTVPVARKTPTSAPPAPSPSTPAPSGSPSPSPAPAALTPVPVSCGAAPVEPAGFTWGFHLNPSYPVAGKPVEWDASATTDTGGTITRYDWDTDGDGTSDVSSTTPVLRFTPAAAGTVKTCLQATDSAGRTATHPYELTIESAGYLYASQFTTAPADPRVGETTTFTPTALPGEADFVCVRWGTSSPDPADDYACGSRGTTFTHTYAAAGKYEPSLTVYNTASPELEVNSWYQYLTVRPAGARARAVVGGQSRTIAAKAKAKPFGLSTPITAKAKLASIGKVKLLSSGAVTIKNAIATGRFKSKPTAKEKKKIPAGLRFLLDADFVASMSGNRVLLSPNVFGLAGKGKILARSRKSKASSVCLTFRSDGLSAAGTVWKIAGATGKAAGWTGSGLATPPLFGPGVDPAFNGAAAKLRPSKSRKGIRSCSALAKRLPGAKKAKKK